MNKVRSIAADEIVEKINDGKRLIIFGAGANTKKFLTKYNIGNFESYLDYIIDNSQQKIGTKLIENGYRYIISSSAVLCKIDLSKYIIIITPKMYDVIVNQLIEMNISSEVYFIDFNIMYREERELIANLDNKLLEDIIILAGQNDTCDNVNAIANYIRDKNYFNSYKLVWLCDNPEKEISTEQEIFLHRDIWKNSRLQRLEYIKYMHLAKYFIFENKGFYKYRKGQRVIYLNHGAPSIKDTTGKINIDFVDLAIASSEFTASEISRMWDIDMSRLTLCGPPRTDVFFEENDNNNIKNIFNFNLYAYNILWAPTFRQLSLDGVLRVDSTKKYYSGLPLINSEIEFDNLNNWLFENNTQLIIKPHIHQDMSFWSVGKYSNINVVLQSDLDDLAINVYMLMKYTDALITDYSSISFDYMLLNKPIAYVVDDWNEYSLGFVDNVESLMPGHKLVNYDELIGYLKDVVSRNDIYYNERNHVLNKVNVFQDGNNSNKLCNILGISL